MSRGKRGKARHQLAKIFADDIYALAARPRRNPIDVCQDLFERKSAIQEAEESLRKTDTKADDAEIREIVSRSRRR